MRQSRGFSSTACFVGGASPLLSTFDLPMPLPPGVSRLACDLANRKPGQGRNPWAGEHTMCSFRYNSKDQKAAVKLKRRLEKAGLKGTSTRARFAEATSSTRRLWRGWRRAARLPVLVGAAWVSARGQKREIAQAAEDPLLHLIPCAACEAASGISYAACLRGLHRIDLTKGLDDTKGIGALVKSNQGQTQEGYRPRGTGRSGGPKGGEAETCRAISVRRERQSGGHPTGASIAGNVTGSILVTGGGNTCVWAKTVAGKRGQGDEADLAAKNAELLAKVAALEAQLAAAAQAGQGSSVAGDGNRIAESRGIMAGNLATGFLDDRRDTSGRRLHRRAHY